MGRIGSAVSKSSIRNRKRRAVLTAAASFMAATILGGLAVTFTPAGAGATPAMAKQTGKPCGACHRNPKGGGPLK